MVRPVHHHPHCSPMPGFGGGERWNSRVPSQAVRATRPGLKHTPRDILLGLLRPKQYANGSKPDGLLPKASRGEGRVKQSQGLVAWGSSGESHFHFPPLCPTAFPLPPRVVSLLGSHAIICKAFTEQVLCARCLGEGAEQARQSPPSWS